MATRKVSAKRLDHTLTFLPTEEDLVFRRNIPSLVRHRFPAARKELCQQLGDSIAIRREMLLQDQRHAKRLAVRRMPEDARADMASPKPQALTTVTSTISTTQEDYFEYPPAPTASEGEMQTQCPFCFVPLERKESEKERNDHWKHHIDEHVKPYTCLYPECSRSLVFFARRHEWKAHVESVHSKDWLRRVANTMVWYCDVDHDTPETFETELQWREHMHDLGNHPKRKLNAPTQAQLDALSPLMTKRAFRDKFACPLCEQIPEQIRPFVEKEEGDSADMYNFMVDHVANHVKSLSLMAVPSFGDAARETSDLFRELAITNESSRRLMNENSVPQLPSGREYVDGTSLPPQAWSSLNRDSIASLASLTMSGPKPSWDKEHSDYTRPEDPPEPLGQEWLESWKRWKNENGSFSRHSLQSDPVLVHLDKTKGTVSGQSTKEITLDESHVDFKNDAGRTQLSLAAEIGDVATVHLLLDKGAHLEIADKNGRTPLLWAADNGHEATVRLLLDKGALVEATDLVYGRTPLSWAASKGHRAVVQLLLCRDAGRVGAADVSRQTPLSLAASEGHEATVRLLMQYGADIKTADPKYGRTPLLWAAVGGHEAVVKLLLDHGVEVDATDLEHGRTPLSWATEKGHKETVEILLAKGAHMEAADRESKQALSSVAAENYHEKAVAYFLKRIKEQTLWQSISELD